MQLQRTCFFLAICAGQVCHAVVLIRSGSLRAAASSRTSESAARRSEVTELAEELSKDLMFWTAQWTALEGELMRLEVAATTKGGRVTMGLQIGATPKAAKNATIARATANVVAMGAPWNVSKHNATMKKIVPLEKVDPAKLEQSLGGAKVNLKNAAMLAPMLSMLKGLYEGGKERIGQMNVEEKASKKKYADREAAHKAKLLNIEANFKSGKLNAEFKANETRDETRIYTYWQRCRDRQHRQYHNMLKLQHSTMEKEKTMIDVYEKTLSGKGDAKSVKKQLTEVSGGSLPEVVFIQKFQQSVVKFCADALKEARTEQDDIASWATEGGHFTEAED